MNAQPTDRLAAAIAALTRRGEAVTVRSLRREAGCSTDAAREYLVGMRVDDTPEEIPDLSAPVAALYGVAYSQASAVLRSEYADDLATARRAEAEAVDVAEQSQKIAHEAQQRQREAESEAATLRERLKDLEERLATAEQRATNAEQKAEDAERRAVDSAATARTLRDVLDTLRPTTPPEPGTANKE